MSSIECKITRQAKQQETVTGDPDVNSKARGVRDWKCSKQNRTLMKTRRDFRRDGNDKIGTKWKARGAT